MLRLLNAIRDDLLALVFMMMFCIMTGVITSYSVLYLTLGNDLQWDGGSFNTTATIHLNPRNPYFQDNGDGTGILMSKVQLDLVPVK